MQVNFAVASFELNVKVGVLSFVLVFGPAVSDTLGAVVSPGPGLAGHPSAVAAASVGHESAVSATPSLSSSESQASPWESPSLLAWS